MESLYLRILLPCLGGVLFLRVIIGKAFLSAVIKKRIKLQMEKDEFITHEGKFWQVSDALLTNIIILLVFYFDSYHPVLLVVMLVYVFIHIDQTFFRCLFITSRAVYYYSLLEGGLVVIPFKSINTITKVIVYNIGVNMLIVKLSGEKIRVLSLFDYEDTEKYIDKSVY